MISKTKLKYLASLKQKKLRDAEKRLLIEGLRLCEEVVGSAYEVESILYCPALLTSERGKQLLDTFQQAGVSIFEIDIKSLNQLVETVHSQGVLAVVQIPKFDINQILHQQPRIIVVLDQIRDPGNLGTIIRTANWFGVGAILLSDKCVEITNPKVVRASMGAYFHIPILEHTDIIQKLIEFKKRGYALFAADPAGTVTYSSAKFTEKNVVIMGNEITGVRAEIKQIVDTMLTIPQSGRGDSLNVAVAAGIILAEITRPNIANINDQLKMT